MEIQRRARAKFFAEERARPILFEKIDGRDAHIHRLRLYACGFVVEKRPKAHKECGDAFFRHPARSVSQLLEGEREKMRCL